MHAYIALLYGFGAKVYLYLFSVEVVFLIEQVRIDLFCLIRKMEMTVKMAFKTLEDYRIVEKNVDGFIRFRLGEFSLTIFNDGSHRYPTSDLFVNISANDIKKAKVEWGIGKSETKIDFMPLLIDTGRSRILLDSGFGEGKVQQAGFFISRLKESGYYPESIDTVIISHCHEDHCGGNILSDGTIAFPNARFIMMKSELDHVFDPDFLDDPDCKYFREIQYPVIKDRLQLLENSEEIEPGVKVIHSPGHTPGLLTLLLESEDEKLFCATDVILNPYNIQNPDSTMSFDVSPEQAVKTRKELIRTVLNEDTYLLAYHFRF